MAIVVFFFNSIHFLVMFTHCDKTNDSEVFIKSERFIETTVHVGMKNIFNIISTERNVTNRILFMVVISITQNFLVWRFDTHSEVGQTNNEKRKRQLYTLSFTISHTM